MHTLESQRTILKIESTYSMRLGGRCTRSIITPRTTPETTMHTRNRTSSWDLTNPQRKRLQPTHHPYLLSTMFSNDILDVSAVPRPENSLVTSTDSGEDVAAVCIHTILVQQQLH